MEKIYRALYWILAMMDSIIGTGQLFPWPPEKLNKE